MDFNATRYVYDELDRLSRVTANDGTFTSYTYDEVGNRKSVSRPNAVTTSYAYDELNRLTDQSNVYAAGSANEKVLSSFTYQVNLDGKRGAVNETVLNPDAVNGSQTSITGVVRTLSYSYDNANRLTQEKREERQVLRAGGETSSTRTTDYSYDAVSNRWQDVTRSYTSLGASAVLGNTFTQVYSYNDNDWLTQVQGTTVAANGVSTTHPATTYGYDNNGAQTSVTTNNVDTPYEYDFEGKLVKVGDDTSSTCYSYKYDTEGDRLSTTTGTSSGTKTAKYLNDTNAPYTEVLETRDENDALQARYLHGDDYAPIREDWTNADNGTSGTSYYLNDGLLSTRQLADAQGGISDSYAYDAWGNNAGVVGNTPNAFRFNGQQLDNTNLYYLRARYYNSGTGRFLSHDPLMGSEDDPETLHRYLYAAAEPVDKVDPGGQFAEMMAVSLGMFYIENQRNIEVASFGASFAAGYAAPDQWSTVNNITGSAPGIYPILSTAYLGGSLGVSLRQAVNSRNSGISQEMADPDIKIFFGQSSVSQNYSNTPDVPEWMRSKPIKEVAALLMNNKRTPDEVKIEYSRDERSGGSQKYFTLNNRGLTGLSLAKKKPTNKEFVPWDKLSKAKQKRLNPLNLLGDAQPASRMPVVKEHLSDDILYTVNLYEGE